MLFVRHGESFHKREGLLRGPVGCTGLTPDGHTQVATLAQRLGEAITGPISVYTSVIRRAIETAEPIAAEFGVKPTQDCGLCTWHLPPQVDGMPVEQFWATHRVDGGGVFRPFERGSETWAEMVTRTSRAIIDIADRHRGETVIIAGHSETVEISFNALALLPLYRSFDLRVSPASVTEWITEDEPTEWPPARWTLIRFNET